MATSKTRSRAATVAMLAVLLAMTACQTRDRAGGNADAEATVLTFAQSSGIRPAQLEAWAGQVARLSKGTLKIEFKDEWRRSDGTGHESAIVADIQQGKADMTWVGARVLDRLGHTGFQALLAPMLVDSHDLQAKVFHAGIPKQMLAGLPGNDLVGVGVLPGPLRRVLGVREPLVSPEAFRGKKIAMQDSAVAEMTFEALGASSVPVVGGAALDGLDGYEQQLSSIVGNHYEQTAKFVTGNINLWPRPLVILMGKNAHDRLSQEHQQILSQAVDDALAAALEESRAEDAEAAPTLCGLGMRLPAASTVDLKALRAAVEPVYDKLRKDQNTARWLEEIQSIKEAIGVGPDTATCPDKAPASSPLEGTWTRTMTADDWIIWPGGETWPKPPSGTWTITFKDGVLTKTDPDGDVERWPYQTFRDRIHAAGTVTIDATFHLDGNRLTFSDFGFGACTDCQGYGITFGGTKKPWIRTPNAG